MTRRCVAWFTLRMDTTPDITIQRFPTGWRLVDTKGRLHSAAITDKARAQRQANHMNAQMARIREGRS